MPLKTVRVPPGMAAPFVLAEEVVSRFFRERRDDPERGTIEIHGERYVLLRAASLSVEFFTLVRDLYGKGREQESEDFARNILFDLAHAVGKADARNFHAKMKLEDPIARLSAGPIHFAHAGWAFVDIFPESKPVPSEDYCLVYDHPYSFESDAWLRAGERRDFPVCIMNAGYSSGWCEESFGLKLVATEILCRARGDDCCRFLMGHPARIEEHVQRYLADKSGLMRRGAKAYSVPDFFARKRIEDELREARDSLEKRVHERTAELRSANEKLQAEIAHVEEVEAKLRQTHKLEALGRLAGGIAHDFNNLMSVVIAHSHLLRAHVAADDPMRERLDQIAQAGHRAAMLTQQLLAFSRAQVLRKDVLALDAVVSELGRMLRPLISEDVELVTRLEAAGATIEADRGQVEQVVMNLVLNARDAMPVGGKLTIETSRCELAADPARALDVPPGAYVRIEVRDTGKGMDEVTLSRIFEPFFTTKGERQGTGLGLSTVYGIVKQSGGAISVKSAPGFGSSFSIYFPESERAAPVPAAEPAPATTLRGSETILVVEDQDDLRAAVRDLLREYGYCVLDAQSSAEALAMVRQSKAAIHLVLTDVIMPVMGGRELAERLVALKPELRIVYMSGYTPDADLREGVRGQPHAFLPKPFLPGQLARKVREVLDAKAPPPR